MHFSNQAQDNRIENILYVSPPPVASAQGWIWVAYYVQVKPKAVAC